MTKKLSKQLCGICNIPFEHHIDNCRVVDNDGDLCEQYVEILDFGQPENFMKLFKIITTIEYYGFSTGCYYINNIPTYKQQSSLLTDSDIYYSNSSSPIKAFIECVIACAKAEKDTADYIKEQEWIYD